MLNRHSASPATLPCAAPVLLALALLICSGASAQAQAIPEHDSAACNLCHFSDDEARAQAGLVQDSGCLACHEPIRGGTNARLGFHTGRKRNCAQCHVFHEPDLLHLPGGRMSRTALERAGTDHCRSCHGTAGRLTDLSAAHGEAALLYHGDTEELEGLSASEGCLLCHGSDSDSQWQRAYPDAVLTFDRHTTHPLGVRNEMTRAVNAFTIQMQADGRLPLFSGRIECQTCHLMTTRNPDLLRTDARTEEICNRCHQRNGPESPVAAAALQ